MLLIFWLTFDVVGDTLSGLLEQGIGALTIVVDGWLKAYGINPIVNSLVIDGIFTGVGSVLTFLPYIVTLFFFLSILEDSGYMARIAFVMDKILRKIGLSGRSIVPLLIGFGCTVPAAMATRTLSSKRDQRFTVMLIPVSYTHLYNNNIPIESRYYEKDTFKRKLISRRRISDIL